MVNAATIASNGSTRSKCTLAWAQYYARQPQVIKQGPHRAVYRVTLDGLSFFVKHNRVATLRAWLRQLVRPSKARQEYAHALAIAARGMPT